MKDRITYLTTILDETQMHKTERKNANCRSGLMRGTLYLGYGLEIQDGMYKAKMQLMRHKLPIIQE